MLLNTGKKRDLQKKIPVSVIIVIILVSSMMAPIRTQADSQQKVEDTYQIIYVGGNQPGTFKTIQSAIHHAHQKDIITILPGIYYETILIDKSITLKGDQVDKTIINGNKGSTIITIKADNVRIENITITDGSGIYPTASIYCTKSERITIKNCSFLNNQCSSIIYNHIQNSSIADNIFKNNTNGIILNESNNLTVVNNRFHDQNQGACIYVSSKHIQGYNHIIQENKENERPILYYYDINNIILNDLNCSHITIAKAENITIQHTDIRRGDGIHLAFVNNSTIQYNQLIDNHWIAILSQFSTNNTISNNIIEKNFRGIDLCQRNCFNDINRNNISDNTDFGIVLSASSCNNTLRGNTIHNNIYGISLDRNIGENISDNHDNSIENNYIYDNTIAGINLYQSDRNIIKNNQLETNKQFGIYLYNTKDNIIYNNKFEYTNRFFDNGRNYWNINKVKETNIVNGPYLGGNYWHEHHNIDTNNDGLGDKAHNIEGGNNQDNYPLLRPENTTYQLNENSSQLNLYLNIPVPNDQVTMKVKMGKDSYFTVNVTNIPDGFILTNGHYYGWCFDKTVYMNLTMEHPVLICQSYDIHMPNEFKKINWNIINYIINHKGEFTKNEIQDAIWSYIENIPAEYANTIKLLQLAEEYGTNYYPSQGDILAVLLYLDPDATLTGTHRQTQNIIIEVTLKFVSYNLSFWRENLSEWGNHLCPDDYISKYFTLPNHLKDLGEIRLAELLSLQLVKPKDLREVYLKLIQEAVVGMLNIEHPDIYYPLTYEQLIVSVNDAFPIIEKTALLSDVLKMYNQIGANAS